jgi:hypothetical protein
MITISNAFAARRREGGDPGGAEERVPEPSETERARRRGEEPYSRTATTPGDGIAKVSLGYGMR